MLIYEVNVLVERPAADEYLEWLNSHIVEMLTFPGFRAARVFHTDETTEDEFALVVHYSVESRSHLANYFSEEGPRMRRKTDEKFEGQYRATRRVLEVVR